MHGTRIATLHGSAAARNGNAVVIIGACGTGKSTTAAALARDGWSVLCDDLVPLAKQSDTEGKKSDVLVLPGIEAPSLLPDAVARLAEGPLLEASDTERPRKRRLHVRGHREPVPLSAIFCLEMADIPEPRIQKVLGYRKTALLIQHMSSIPGLDQAGTQFLKLSDFQAEAPLFLITRPRDKDSLSDIVSIIGDWQKGILLPA